MNDSIDLGGHSGQTFQWGEQGTQPGAFVVGKILALAEVQSTDYKTKQPETWDNGDPKMQYRISLQTDLRDPANAHDDGKRDVYLDGSRKVRDNGTKSRLAAVLEAVRAVTGGTAMQVGGYLRLQWVSGMGFSGDPRNYEAQYQAPAIELGQPVQAPAQPVAVPQGQPVQMAPPASTSTPAFAQAVADPWAGQAQQPFAGQPVQPVNTQAAPPVPAAQAPGVPTPEQVAAVRAGGMDPAKVWPGVQLPAGV